MNRTTSQRQKVNRSPSETNSDLARHIVSYGHPPHEPHYFDIQTENLLIRMLPGGMEEALERMRTFRAAPNQSPEELGFQSWDPPEIVFSVVAQAESALAAHVERTTRRIPCR
jgi:hypothetical protein